jgi:hypothetical protein
MGIKPAGKSRNDNVLAIRKKQTKQKAEAATVQDFRVTRIKKKDRAERQTFVQDVRSICHSHFIFAAVSSSFSLSLFLSFSLSLSLSLSLPPPPFFLHVKPPLCYNA